MFFYLVMDVADICDNLQIYVRRPSHIAKIVDKEKKEGWYGK